MPGENMHELLGAGPSAGTVQFSVFVPGADRSGTPIDQESWREETLGVLGTLFRGATAFPPGRGVWRDDEADGALLFEDVVLVTSYASPDDVTDEALGRLRVFLHRLGRKRDKVRSGSSLTARTTASSSSINLERPRTRGRGRG